MSFVPGAILEADCDAKSIAVRLATIISFSVGSVARTDAGSGNKTPILYIGVLDELLLSFGKACTIHASVVKKIKHVGVHVVLLGRHTRISKRKGRLNKSKKKRSEKIKD